MSSAELEEVDSLPNNSFTSSFNDTIVDKKKGLRANKTIQIEPPSSILYSDAENTVFVVDLPTSIARAQSLAGEATTGRQLLSCPVLPQPYPSTEPKSEKARAKVLDRLDQSKKYRELHHEYARLITDALEKLSQQRSKMFAEPQPFCLPRVHKVAGEPHCNTNQTLKRKAADECIQRYKSNTVQPKLTLMQNHRQSASSDEASSTILPSLSTVLLGPIDTSLSALSTFHTACLSHSTDSHSLFQFIVLDPPWPNKSVSRSSSYLTSPSLADLKGTLQGIGLEQHLKQNGYVACWVTNTAAIYDAVVGEGGLFEAWDVNLVEEWVWCKVTAKGEPVTNVSGVWRKPYEVCLIGQLKGPAKAQRATKKRVILGVPDLHSRKPCLKELVERLLLKNESGNGSSRTALELYARYAVAGWMSWGLEATKYNHEEWWRDLPSEKGKE